MTTETQDDTIDTNDFYERAREAFDEAVKEGRPIGLFIACAETNSTKSISNMRPGDLSQVGYHSFVRVSEMACASELPMDTCLTGVLQMAGDAVTKGYGAEASIGMLEGEALPEELLEALQQAVSKANETSEEDGSPTCH